MAISFARLESYLQAQHISVSRLKTDKVLGGSSYTIIRKAMATPIEEGLSISAIDAICHYLNCQPGDIMEYIPDQPNADPEAAPQADQPQNNP